VEYSGIIEGIGVFIFYVMYQSPFKKPYCSIKNENYIIIIIVKIIIKI